MPTTTLRITWQRLHPEAEVPRRSTERAGARDLKAFLLASPTRLWAANEESVRAPDRDPHERDGTPFVDLPPGARAIVPTGLRARLPEAHVALILPRSGTSFRTTLALANAPGLVDEDYPGEWGILVKNDGPAPLRIFHGDRIAQMLVVKAEQLDDEEGEVERTTDRAGGFGSTGR